VRPGKGGIRRQDSGISTHERIMQIEKCKMKIGKKKNASFFPRSYFSVTTISGSEGVRNRPAILSERVGTLSGRP
jgi:hypothetical protein